MNSVTRYTTPATLAATLFTMRSGKKEVFLIVEGDSDIDLFSQILKISYSNLLSCGGKENLMKLASRSPAKGIDAGTIFFRDRDHDGVSHRVYGDSPMYVTDRYDIEMEMACGGVFPRIFREYAREEVPDEVVTEAFSLVTDAAAWLGAARLVGSRDAIAFDFENIKYNRFLDMKEFLVNESALSNYLITKSQIANCDPDEIVKKLRNVRASHSSIDLSCGKEFIALMEIALSRWYKFCNQSDCSVSVLTKILRISSDLELLRGMSFYDAFREHVKNSGFGWFGVQL